MLFRELLRQHERICGEFGVDKPENVSDGMVNECVISYGVLCDLLGVPFLTHSVGNFLGESAEWCSEKGWPPLNALAVNNERWMPGDGYNEAVGCSLFDWANEVKKCIAFGGYPTSTSI